MIRIIRNSCIFLWALLISAGLLAAPKNVVVDVQASSIEDPPEYFMTLLQMALEASKAQDETIEVKLAEQDLSQARWVYLVQHEDRNRIIWFMTSKERESQLRPIRIPLIKGLYGKRIFIIRAEDQERFDKIQTQEQLMKLMAGQGDDWPDTNILRANKIPVTTGMSTESLFKMLKAKRFDYFPRSVSEAWLELEQYKGQGFAIEKNLLLEYPAPMYFFVSKNNQPLAQRIELGLERLMASGEFDIYFREHLRRSKGIELLNAQQRRVIKVDNPELTDETPLDNEKYWLDLPSLNSAVQQKH